MSYLSGTRLTFSGQFQADVSTVNNDVRHFSNKDWETRFQAFQTRISMGEKSETLYNGWWNPPGTGAFRLIDCAVRSVNYANGTGTTDSASDPVIGAGMLDSDRRSAGKLVDIDSQWQLCSEIWGMSVRAVAADGVLLFSGRFKVSPFRDLLFSRAAGGGDSAASATFVSRLTHVEWGPAADRSPLLCELRACSLEGQLSIRLMTYGYTTNSASDTFTYGLLSGAIGPACAEEPERFVLGRRMVAANGSASQVGGINFFDCAVEADGARLLLDLSNALPLASSRGPLADLGDLTVALLNSDDIQESDNLTPDQYTVLGSIPYRNQDWLKQTGGILELAVDEVNREALQGSPLALLGTLKQGAQTFAEAAVLIRETKAGRFVRIDNFVQRVEANGAATVRLWAAQYGQPLVGEAVVIRTQKPMKGLGGTGPGEYKAPAAKIPVANTPTTIITVPDGLKTCTGGLLEVVIPMGDPQNPRVYVEGQLYVLDYNFSTDPITKQQFDSLIVLLHDGARVPEHPTWAHVAPWMQQYSNLYPIMSRMMVDLGNREAVLSFRQAMILAFSLPMADPNHMPATRDLSEPRRQTILKWLRSEQESALETARPAHRRSAARPKVRPAAAAQRPQGGETEGGKTTFYRQLLAARSNTEDDL